MYTINQQYFNILAKYLLILPTTRMQAEREAARVAHAEEREEVVSFRLIEDLQRGNIATL